MGLSAGDDIADGMIGVIEDLFLDDTMKTTIYKGLIETLQESGWETVEEVFYRSRCFDRAAYLLNPDCIGKEYTINKKGEDWWEFITNHEA